VPTALKRAWQTDVGGKVTSPVIAGGKVFVASVDTHTVHALDADSGKELWQYTTGARVDSPPTIHQGRAIFGSHDGYVYCLDAADGALAWRFRAAPMDQCLMSFEQVESVWPVHGSVLVQNGAVYCVAGRSMFVDDGLHFWRLDPKTGREISHTILGDHDEKGKDLHEYVAWLNMVPALPDILSSDGRHVYMRSQPFNLDGTRLPLAKPPAGKDADAGAPPPTQNPEFAHLFSPTGFLDDTWWHRTYWMYGNHFVSGWCGYFLSGKVAPAGRILVHDDTTVYGFGRKPQYYRWTTPIEHQLFAARKTPSSAPVAANSGPSLIRIEKSKSLNPAGKAITVQAWVKAEKPAGVILAHGGGALGYTLHLQAAKPHFTIRAGGKLTSVAAKEKVAGKWTHIAGVLTAEKDLRIYVNGRLCASTKVPAPITADPQEAMEIGTDDNSAVAQYKGSITFTGLIDEISVYHRALNTAEIENLASSGPQAAIDKTALVLSYSFDKPKPADASGNNNKPNIQGAVAAKGKFGRAMKFTGAPAKAKGYLVNHDWTADLPIFARAMVLADKTLFVAGPPDIIDAPPRRLNNHRPNNYPTKPRHPPGFRRNDSSKQPPVHNNNQRPNNLHETRIAPEESRKPAPHPRNMAIPPMSLVA